MSFSNEVKAHVDDILKIDNPLTQAELLTSLKQDAIREQVLLNFISTAPGAFCVTHIAKDRREQLDYTQDCEFMVMNGKLNRFGNKRGWYTPVNLDMQEMDYVNADEMPIDVWLPFGLNKKVYLYPDNVIILAGAPNAGKTSIILNIIKENMTKFNIHYFNSEMSAGELKTRLSLFDYIDIDQWDFKAYRRAEDFHDVIIPGEGNLNIIDYLEVFDDFFAVGKKIKQIHNKLDGAVAIVAIQKNPGTDVGLGGFRSLEVTRLALAVDFGRLKIVKAKNYKGEEDPNGLVTRFSIFHGGQLSQKDGWHKDTRGGD